MWLPTDERYRDFLDEFLPINERYYAGKMTPVDWQRWYEVSLRKVVAHVQNGSPFYAEHLAGVDAASSLIHRR